MSDPQIRFKFEDSPLNNSQLYTILKETVQDIQATLTVIENFITNLAKDNPSKYKCLRNVNGRYPESASIILDSLVAEKLRGQQFEAHCFSLYARLFFDVYDQSSVAEKIMDFYELNQIFPGVEILHDINSQFFVMYRQFISITDIRFHLTDIIARIRELQPAIFKHKDSEYLAAIEKLVSEKTK